MILFALCLLASLEPHFKKAENKTEEHAMPGIDFIYMLNLDHRPEKWNHSLQKLIPYGIYPYRFSAINGSELSLETINDVGVVLKPTMKVGLWGTFYRLKKEAEEPQVEGYCKANRPFDGPYIWEQERLSQIGRTYFSHCMSRAAIAIVLSHLSILHDAYTSGYETIWVMEDDIAVVRDPREISQLIVKLDQLAPGWDILFTDPDTKNNAGEYIPCYSYAERPNFAPRNPWQFFTRENISAEFRKIGARYGAYSMIVRRSGIKKILDFFEKYQIFLPFDMEYTLPPGIKLYTVLTDIVSTEPNSPSDNG